MNRFPTTVFDVIICGLLLPCFVLLWLADFIYMFTDSGDVRDSDPLENMSYKGRR